VAARCLAVLGLLAALSAPAAPAAGCDIPVFRYALERWQPDAYRAVIFHRGELAPEAHQALAALRAASRDGGGRANLVIQTVDLAGDVPVGLQALWEHHQAVGKPALPHVVLAYPGRLNPRSGFWSGPLSPGGRRAIADSPVRRDIAQQLLAGRSAVWVLLECGDAAKDRAAAELLEAELATMPRRLTLPRPAAMSSAALAGRNDEPEPVPPIRIDFSLVRLSRRDPAEEVLAATLLGSESDLRTRYAAEPVAFPVYGRGRTLYALVGPGISAANILATCRFLCGPCACDVKDEQPGVDLLMTAAWDDRVTVTPLETLELPSPIGGAAGDGAAAASEARGSPTASGGALLRNVLIAAGFIAVVMVLVVFYIMRRYNRS
jgi:hypothetical protein